MKTSLWSYLLIVGALAFFSTGADAGRLAYSSDRNGDYDVYKSTDDLSTTIVEWQVTDESGDAHNPTIAPNGQYIIYDVGGVLYLSDLAYPERDPVLLGGGMNPDAAKSYLNLDRDFRIIYAKGVSGTIEIFMGTIDVSEEELVDVVALTENSSYDNFQPAFCGDDHFVWVHDDSYASALCFQEFDEDGPVDSPSCYVGVPENDSLYDHYPGCDSTGTYVAWAREDPGYSDGRHDIWTAEVDDFVNTAVEIQAGADDETMPVWNPGDSEIAFAWNRALGGSNDYEIWVMNDDGTGEDNITDNTDDDTEPAWGPSALPCKRQRGEGERANAVKACDEAKL